MQGKKRGGATTKAPRKQATTGSAVCKKRLNVRIDAEPHERMMVHCMKKGIKPGAFVSALVNANCRDWHIHANPRGPGGIAGNDGGFDSGDSQGPDGSGE